MRRVDEINRKILFVRTGIKKEAYLFKVPCVTLRDSTEWVETLEDGWNVLIGANKEKIVKVTNDFEPKNKQRDVFGCGDLSAKIREIIKEGRWEKNGR